MSIPLSTGAAIIPKGITGAEFENLILTLQTWKEQMVSQGAGGVSPGLTFS